MSDTPQNDDLMRLMAGRSDAEHLIALDVLSRRLEVERGKWEADALLRAQNTEYWRQRAEKAEAQIVEREQQDYDRMAEKPQ